MLDYLPVLILLMVVAALLKADAVLTIFYLITGVYVFGRWWTEHSITRVSIDLLYSRRAFLNSIVPIQLKVENHSILPAVWLQLHVSLPVALISPSFFQQVVSLGPRQKNLLEFKVRANKRGYYSIGPTYVQAGDLIGLSKELERQVPADYLIVYPMIYPLQHLKLPSRSPFGTIRHSSPIYEDPSRVMGKRDYQVGDSLRRVDWKATASTGRMQVKIFEPSISLETSLFLSLNTEDYDIQTLYDATETAITTAASIASWAAGKKQNVGLYSNGLDPLAENAPVHPIPSRKGINHLMTILDCLARIQAGPSIPFVQLLRQSIPGLAWGTTLVLITGHQDNTILDELFQAQRAGLNAVIILVGRTPGFQEFQTRARRFGILAYQVQYQKDLETW